MELTPSTTSLADRLLAPAAEIENMGNTSSPKSDCCGGDCPGNVA